MKKCLSIILAVVMVFSMIGSTAPYVFAEDAVPEQSQTENLSPVEGQKGSTQSGSSGLVATLKPRCYIVPDGDSQTINVPFSHDPDYIGNFSFYWNINNNGYYTSGNTYTIDNITSQIEGFCTITDDYGYNVQVSFYIYPESQGIDTTITATPEWTSTVVETGQSASPSISFAQSNDPWNNIYYQWYDSDKNLIEGEWSSWFITPGLTQDTTYYCVVSNDFTGPGCQNGVEVRFDIYVQTPPISVTAKDPNRTASIGDDVLLEVTAVSDHDSPLTYQWYYQSDGNGAGQIDGATSSDFVVSNIQHSARYQCVVTDDAWNCRSGWFKITVSGAAPYFEAYTNCQNQTAIIGEYTTLNVDYAESIDSSGAFLPLTFEWYDQSDAIMPNAYDSWFSTPTITEDTSFYCIVTDSNGDTRRVDFTVTTVTPPIVVTSHNIDLTVDVGDSVPLVVNADSTIGSSLSYQWYRSLNNGVWWESETTSSLLVHDIQHYALYTCRVYDEDGNEDYVAFTINVNGTPAYTEALTFTPEWGVRCPGESVHLCVDLAESRDSSGNLHPLTYEWHDQSGSIVQNGSNNWYDTPGLTESTSYYCVVYGAEGLSDRVDFIIPVRATSIVASAVRPNISINAGDDVLLEVNAYSTDGYELGFLWSQQISNGQENIDGAISNSCLVENVRHNGVYTCYIFDYYGNEMRVNISVTVIGATAYTEASASQPIVIVESGESAFLSVSHIESVDASGDLVNVSFEWHDQSGAIIPNACDAWYNTPSITADTSYYCIVTGSNGLSAKVNFSVQLRDITAEAETSFTAALTDTDVTLTVIASSDHNYPLHYQWVNWWGQNVGEDQPTYTVHEPTTGTLPFSCIVTNEIGESRTVQFRVKYLRDLNYSVDPYNYNDLPVRIGASANIGFMINYPYDESVDPFFCQWYYSDGTPVTGETNTWLYINPFTGSPLEYYCEVWDNHGHFDTFHYSLVVDNCLYVEHWPNGNSFTVQLNSSLKLDDQYFTIVADDTTDMVYQWYVEDANGEFQEIPGATDPEYTLSNITHFTRLQLVATDKYGTSVNAQFHIYVENGLQTAPENPIVQWDTSGVQFKVLASSDAGAITYQWYEDVRGHKIAINGANSDTFTVTSNSATKMYTCIVTDVYGNSQNVDFLVENNDVTEIPVEYIGTSAYQSDRLYATRYASPPNNEKWFKTTLSVPGYYTIGAVAGGGEGGESIYKTYDQNMHYIDDPGMILGRPGEVYYMQYANTDVLDEIVKEACWLNVDADFYAFVWGKTERETSVSAAYNNTVDLKVDAFSPDGLVFFQWYLNGTALAGEAGTNGKLLQPIELTTAPITADAEYVCKVTGPFGEQADIVFHVRPYLISLIGSTKRYVSIGDSVDLSVTPAIQTGGITYQWFEVVNGNASAIFGAGSLTYTVNNVTATRSFFCRAADSSGFTEDTEIVEVSPLTSTVQCVDSGSQTQSQSTAAVDDIVPVDVLDSAVANGESVLVSINVSQTVDADEIKYIKMAIADDAGVDIDDIDSVEFISINLQSQIGSDSAVDIHETNNPIEITIDVPNAPANKSFVVYRLHGDAIDVIPSTYDPATGKITVISDKFSAFGYVEEIVYHEVNFEPNADFWIGEQYVLQGDSIVPPDLPEWEGYIFEGWFTDEACTSAYDLEAPVTEDLTLYAKWTWDGYTVSIIPDDTRVLPGDEVTFTVTLENVDHLGSFEIYPYISEGLTYVNGSGRFAFEASADNPIGFDTLTWDESTKCISGSAAAANYSGSEPVALFTFKCKVTDDMEYDACVGLEGFEFSSIDQNDYSDSYLIKPAVLDRDQYMVLFYENKGDDEPFFKDFRDVGSNVTVPSDDPEKTGYTFFGWDMEIPEKMPAEDLIINAKWTINQYTISFYANEDDTIPFAAITQNYGTALNGPEEPTKEGYIFDGWDAEIPATMPAEDLSLYATWIKGPDVYKVSGKVESFSGRNPAEDDDIVTIILRQNGVAVGDPKTVRGTDNEYSFYVEPGTYTITVSKNHHVPREYDVEVTDEAVELDLKIHLKGDINGDGRISMADVSMAIGHVTEKKLLTGYGFQCADVLGADDGGPNGDVTTVDLVRINSQARGYSYMW